MTRFDIITAKAQHVLLIGCGAIGSVIARHLVASDSIAQTICADVDGSAAKRVASGTRSRKARAMELDAGDPGELRRAMEGVGVVVNATIPRFNEAILAAALDSGAHYLDMAMGEEDPFAHDEAWRRRGLTALTGMGEDPGLSNVFARHAADSMDRVDAIRVRDGETASNPEYPFIALFSPETLVEETLVPAHVYREGTWHEVPPLSDFEDYPFPEPVGTVPVCTVEHEEVWTLPKFLGKPVAYVDFRLALDPPTVERLKTFRDMGLLQEGPPGGPSPRKALFSRIPKPADLVGRVDGYAVVLVEAIGEQDGRRKIHTLYSILEHHEAGRTYGATGTAYLTGTGGATGALLLASGGVEAHGVLAPEQLDPKPVFAMLRERGVEVRERVTWDRSAN
ncbi:MAG: saccharopine dehydrogenase family protein [Methanobacteriota archaeon]